MGKVPEHGFASKVVVHGDPRVLVAPQADKIFYPGVVEATIQSPSCPCSLRYSLTERILELSFCDPHRLSFTSSGMDVTQHVDRIVG